MHVSMPPGHDDPFFFDQESLRQIAAEQVIGEGLRFFKDHQVLAIDQDGDRLWGRVEDEEEEMPLVVEITVAEDGGLLLACDCAASRSAVCRHQVAALYAYADQKVASDQLLSAADTAINDRVKRGRSEVAVTHLSGKLWFGLWHASTMSSATHFPRRYQVTIRSLIRRANFCTCPDFLVNQLGTCKHIEAVLHKIGKRSDYGRIRKRPAPVSYVFLSWEAEDAPRLMLHRVGGLPAELKGLLDSYFDAAGAFTGRMPDDFFRFAELVENRGDLDLGEDALQYCRRLAADASHSLRAEKIRARISAGGGRLPGIKTRLYPYQVEGAAFLAATGRALLADDMGLGKTLQAISAACWLTDQEGVRRTLIICPASLKQQWAREIERFTDLECQVIQGPASERGVQYRREAAFFILNYELVLRDLSLISETLRPDLIIMDEAQRIKNWRTKIASAVKLIPSRYAFVLTGTPLENRLEDLYSLMQVVDSRVLGPLWRYLVDFHVTDERGKVLGYRNLSLLRQRLAPVMLRRDRRLVRDQLPDRIVQRIDVELTVKQRELHDSAMTAAGSLASIARRRPLTPGEQNRLLAALQQARMACDAAGLVDKETQGSPKLDELADILDEVCLQSGLKAVVFSQWEQMTRMVEERLKRLGIGFVRLHGGVPTAQRGSLMDRFRDDDSVQVFLSTDAGGVGLNLQSGAVLINLDIPWNPAVLEQRNARIHRLGQTRTVQIINMVAIDAYEEQVFAMVQNKQLLFDNVISEDASEDVVGVSKKLLETLIEELTGGEEGKRPEKQEEETSIVAEEAAPPSVTAASAANDEVEQALTRCIKELQQVFGARIERILGSGGGLLAVLDRVEPADDQVAERLSQEVPVALIDRLALKGLQRLGAGSPLAQASTLYDGVEAAGAAGISRLRRRASELLQTAQTMLAQQMVTGALELLMGSLLTAAADRAGREAPIPREEITVWAFGEALPRGLLDQQEVGLLMRAIGFAQGATVPDQLLRELVADTERFVEGRG